MISVQSFMFDSWMLGPHCEPEHLELVSMGGLTMAVVVGLDHGPVCKPLPTSAQCFLISHLSPRYTSPRSREWHFISDFFLFWMFLHEGNQDEQEKEEPGDVGRRQEGADYIKKGDYMTRIATVRDIMREIEQEYKRNRADREAKNGRRASEKTRVLRKTESKCCVFCSSKRT